MRNKIENIIEKYDALTIHLGELSLIGDHKTYGELAKQHHNMKPMVHKGREYLELLNHIDDDKTILEEDDEELKSIAKEELEELLSRQEQLEEELKILLIPKDPRDDKSTIVEIRGGTGGEEAAIFAADLYRMYTKYAERKKWSIEVLSSNETGSGGLKEIIFSLNGKGAYGTMKFEGGVHRVQRVPVTETSGRIHTSAATVAVLPEADEIDIEIEPSDLRIDTYRAQGAGGQHVNKTESAVRITHIPTGVVVICQDEKSQHKNKAAAMKVLRSRLLALEEEKQRSEIDKARKSMVSTGDRSAKIRTYNFPQGRVTDHRIELTLYKLQSIMDGDIDELIEQLRIADQLNRLNEDM